MDARPVITLHNPNGTVVVKAWTKSEVMVIATRATDQVEVDAKQTGNRVDIMTHPVSDAAARPDDFARRLRNPRSGGRRTSDSRRFRRRQRQQRAGRHERRNRRRGSGPRRRRRLPDREDHRRVVPMPALRRPQWRFLPSAAISGLWIFAVTTFARKLPRGNILFSGEFLPNGMYRMKNYSGVIEVRFSPGDSFDLSATSLKGKVNNEAKLSPPNHHSAFLFEIRQQPVRLFQLGPRQSRALLLRWYNQHPEAQLDFADSG